MSSKALIPLIVGCAVGLFAIKMVVDVVQKAQGVQSGSLTPVVFASREIPAYDAIHQDMLRVTQVPKDAVPESAFKSMELLDGRVAAYTIYKGMAVVGSMLCAPGTIPGITAVIPEGYRAVSVKVDEETGGAGFIKPGHHVDVATVMSVKRGSKTEIISRVILQNVEVVAAGQQLNASDDAEASLSRSITLAVKAEDVANLHLAATRGKIRLAIRNNADDRSRNLHSTTEGRVLGEEEESQVADARPQGRGIFSWFGGRRAERDASHAGPLAATAAMFTQPWSVVVINGDRKETIRFRDSESMTTIGPGNLSPSVIPGGSNPTAFNQALDSSDPVGGTGRQDALGTYEDPEPVEDGE